MRRIAFSVALAVGLPALLACPFSFPNEQHCTRQGGDSYCAGLEGAGNYCALDGCGAYDETDNVTGCVDTPPSDADCYRPCGDGADDCTIGTESSSSSSTSTTEPSTSTTLSETSSSGTTEETTTTGPTGCEGCEEARMICVDDVCLSCASEEHEVSCLDEYPFLIDQDPLPYCVNDACQACTYSRLAPLQEGMLIINFDLGCSLDLPACHPDDGTCFYCESHDECESEWCFPKLVEVASGFPDGLCMPPDLVYVVSASRGSLSGDGSEENPFANLAQAFEVLNTESPSGLIWVEPGEYTQPLDLPEHHIVVIRGRGATRPVLRGANLTLPLQGKLVLENLTITGNTGPGIQADGGILMLREVEIVGNGGPGIEGQRLTALDATNSIIAGNGGPAIDVLSLSGRLVYTTLTNEAVDTNTPAVTCTNSGNNTVTIERCLYAGNSSSAFSCPGTTALGTPLLSDFDGVFVDPVGLDFHVNAGAGGLEPLGPPQDHFPSSDIDGDSRSAGDRVGADVP